MNALTSVPASRLLRGACLLLLACALGACGFHLRQSAALPPGMQRVHVVVNGNYALQQRLVRALQTSGANVEDQPGAGIAELRVPVAAFSTETLSAGGYARVSEFAVHFQVQFEVVDGSGHTLVARQRVDMSREYSYDATNTVGNASQVQAIEQGLNDDMVQSILFRLQAAGRKAPASPAGA